MSQLVGLGLIILCVWWLTRPETYRFENERTFGVPQIIPKGLPPGQTIFVEHPAGDLDRLEIFYRSAGNPENPPLLLIHGLAGDSGTTWYNTYATMSQSYYVIAPDLRGHGYTMRPPGDYSIEILAEDLFVFMAALGIQQASVAGHSMGGLVAMQLAHIHEESVKNLILIDTAASWRQGWYEHSLRLYAYWVRIKNRTVGWEQENRDRASAFTRYEIEPQYHEWIYQRRNLNQAKSFIAAWRAIADFSAVDFLPGFRQATLIIYGEDDDLVPPEFRIQLNELILNATMHIIPGPARHYPQIEFEEQVNMLMSDFLRNNSRTD